MFGHDENDGNQQDNQDHTGQVAGPTSSGIDDNLGLGDETQHQDNPGSTAPIVQDNSPHDAFGMDPVMPPAATSPVTSSPASTAAPAEDLLKIKQEALQHLSPLVGHLDQTPEEKFKTMMMMIQASDDQSMLKTAYDTAKTITDEKVRAQALLDVVNEINYFTQQKK